MVDRFEGRAEHVNASAARGFAITPSDAADLFADTRAVYVGGAGNLAMVLISGDEITLQAIGAGSVLPIRARRIKSTGTTATHLVGLY